MKHTIILSIIIIAGFMAQAQNKTDRDPRRIFVEKIYQQITALETDYEIRPEAITSHAFVQGKTHMDFIAVCADIEKQYTDIEIFQHWKSEDQGLSFTAFYLIKELLIGLNVRYEPELNYVKIICVYSNDY